MKRSEIEIRDHAHLMDAEGSQDTEPSAIEITTALESEGFSPRNILISEDTLQGVWRWSCDLLRV